MNTSTKINQLVHQIKTDFDNDCYGRPTDIIGFSKIGKNLALALQSIIDPKEICFYDFDVKRDSTFHYLDFEKMLAKSEIMIITEPKYLKLFNSNISLNKNTKIYSLY